MTITHVPDSGQVLPTTPDTVAIMAFPDERARAQPVRGEGLLAKLDRIARYKRNARSPEYMRQVAMSMLPHARVVEVDGTMPAATVAPASHIVLLWPDAIGHGWMPLERQVFRFKRDDASVYALSGRRRAFRLTRATLWGLRLRRLAERLWLGEAVMALGLLVTAPFLVMWDFARGHR